MNYKIVKNIKFSNNLITRYVTKSNMINYSILH